MASTPRWAERVFETRAHGAQVDTAQAHPLARVVPCQVFLFTHQMAEVRAQFVQITTATAKVALTPGHFLYANGKLVQAHAVQLGDMLSLGDGALAPVSHISREWASGLFNPHTKHGDIVVDGVKASCYTEAVHPKLAHALLAPVRMLYEAGVLFGASFVAGPKSPAYEILPAWLTELIRA